MTIARTFLLTCLLSGATFSAQALDLGPGLTLTGDIELEHADGEPIRAESLQFADITLSWRASGGGALGFGADLALVAQDRLQNQGDASVAFWGGPVLTTPLGDLAIGRPRPVLTRMIDLPRLGGLRVLDDGLAKVTGSLAEVAANEGDNDSLGLVFVGATGNLSYGLGLHRFEALDIRVAEAAIAYQLGATRLFAAIEDVAGFDFRKVMVGASHDFGRLRVGGLLSRVTEAGATLDVTRLHATLAVTDRLDLGLQHLRQTQSGQSAELTGVTAEYRFGSGFFAEAGLLKSSGAGDVANLSVGWRF
jgi:hypothetical protein